MLQRTKKESIHQPLLENGDEHKGKVQYKTPQGSATNINQSAFRDRNAVRERLNSQEMSNDRMSGPNNDHKHDHNQKHDHKHDHGLSALLFKKDASQRMPSNSIPLLKRTRSITGAMRQQSHQHQSSQVSQHGTGHSHHGAGHSHHGAGQSQGSQSNSQQNQHSHQHNHRILRSMATNQFMLEAQCSGEHDDPKHIDVMASLDEYFWKAEERFKTGPKEVILKESSPKELTQTLRQISKNNPRDAPRNFNPREYQKYLRGRNQNSLAIAPGDDDTPEHQKAKDASQNEYDGHGDVRQKLRGLGKLHEHRDAMTMLFKCQMSCLEQYLPQIKQQEHSRTILLQKDVVLYNNNLFVLQYQEYNDVRKMKFDTKLNVGRLSLGSQMDCQESESQKKLDEYANIQLSEITYEDMDLFKIFKKKLNHLFYQNNSEFGSQYELVVDRRVLYYWKVERHIVKKSHKVEPPNLNKLLTSKQNQSDFQPNIQKAGAQRGIDNCCMTVFRLFKLDLGKDNEGVEPIEIPNRAIMIEDCERMMAIQIGFIRNQTEKIYKTKTKSYGIMDETPFLNDQYVVIKYVPTNFQDPQKNKIILQIKSLARMTELIQEYKLDLRDQICILSIATKELKESTEQHKTQRPKLKMDSIMKSRRTQEQVNQILAALREKLKKKIMEVLDEEQRRLYDKKSLILVINNNIKDIIDIQKKIEGPDQQTSHIQMEKKRDELSQEFKELLYRIMFNNCFVTLFDPEKGQNGSYFYKRTEPILQNHGRIFMIQDSMFSKIITVSIEGSDFFIKSVILPNYGQSYEILSFQKLSEDFPKFKEKYQKNLLFSNRLALHAANQNEKEKYKQIIISKRYQNLARVEDTVIHWSKNQFKPKEVFDPKNKVKSLQYMNVSYLSSKLINQLRVDRNKFGMETLAYFTLLPENKTNNPHLDWAGKLTVQIDALEPFRENLEQNDAHSMCSHDSDNFYQGEKTVRFHMNEDGFLIIAEGDEYLRSEQRTDLLMNQYTHDLVSQKGDSSRDMSMSFTGMDQSIDLGFSRYMDAKKNHTIFHKQDMKKDRVEKLKTSWRFFYEKIRFTEDDRSERPLVVCRMLKNERQKLLEIKYWLIVLDFAEQVILQQYPLIFPELDLLYEPHTVCIAASSEPIRVEEKQVETQEGHLIETKYNSINFMQNFQVSISLEHQRRVKICEFMIEWGEVRVDQDDISSFLVKDIEIYYVGLKELILSKTQPGKIEDIFDPILLPLFNDKNDIDGTQLVFRKENNHHLFIFRNDDEWNQKKVPDNQMLERAGYYLYRNKTSFQLEAVLAFATIRMFMIKERNLTKLTCKDTCHILEQSVKIILNSVVLDPMQPVFRLQSIPFFQEYSLGLCYESLNWFSPISVKGIRGEFEMIFSNHVHNTEDSLTCCTEFERQIAYPFTSLIQRVMQQDYHSFSQESILTDDKCDMNFNRLATLLNDRMLYRKADIIQRDIYFLSPMHYLMEQDLEIDFLLEHIFEHFELGDSLPEAEEIFKSMMAKFLAREEPLKLYHQKFMAPQVSRQEFLIGDQNDQPGQTMKFAQKIRGKTIPKKQGCYLQVFPRMIPEILDHSNIEVFVQKQLELEDLEHGIEYEVETYIVDFRLVFMDNKIEWIRNMMKNPDFKEVVNSNFTQFDLAHLINDIQRNQVVNFDDEFLLKNLIDYQWQNTQWWQQRFFLIYFCFYLMPFFFQIFQENETVVILCNCSCMITICWLCFYEYLQYLSSDGWEDYISDFWNINDFAHVMTYGVLYFWLRITRPDDSIITFYQFEQTVKPWDEGYSRMYAIKCILTTTNITLCAQAVMKMLNYLRVFEKFGLFILLIGQCLVDLSFFFIFMFMWLIVFTVMLYILGSGVPNPEDFPHCPDFIQLILQVWRNSLGDIQPPEYERYVQKYEQMKEYNTMHGYDFAQIGPVNILISLIWIVWLLNCIFNQIIMLNFMISIIQASYDKVLHKQNQMMYRYKCDLNIEVENFKSYFLFWTGKQDVFNSVILITAGDQEENESDQLSFLHMVRGMISKILQVQWTYQEDSKLKLEKLQDVQAEMKDYMESIQTSNNNYIKNEIQGINIQLEDITQQIDKMNAAISNIVTDANEMPRVEEIEDDQIDKLGGQGLRKEHFHH